MIEAKELRIGNLFDYEGDIRTVNSHFWRAVYIDSSGYFTKMSG